MSGTPNPLDMDDEAFSKLSGPPVVEEPTKEETTQEEVVDDTTSDDVSNAEDNDPAADAGEPDEADETESGDEGTEPDLSQLSDEELLKTPAPTDKAKPEEEAAKSEDTDKEPDGDKKPEGEKQENVEQKEEKPSVKAEDAISFYEQIMKPFKANGKEIELKSPEEAIALMQMGANYTRKLQEMQPHKKMLLMLQNNDMLDESKLSYLIDLHNKKPEAIKQLIKDAQIDPLDLDIDENSTYEAEDHSVTDNEVVFRSTVDELTSTVTGKETIIEINNKWDQASKDALWDKPEIMSVIHQQRELGIYDVITTEMDRRITLGQIPADTPFIEAYKLVGDELAAEALKSSGNGETVKADESSKEEKPTAQPVATRVAAPKAKVVNDDKAKAASPSRGTAPAPKPTVNYLAQDDSEFLKNFNGRV